MIANPLAALALLGQNKTAPSAAAKYRAGLSPDRLRLVEELRAKNNVGYGNDAAKEVYAPMGGAVTVANALPGMLEKAAGKVQETVGLFESPKPTAANPSPKPAGVQMTKTQTLGIPDVFGSDLDEFATGADEDLEDLAVAYGVDTGSSAGAAAAVPNAASKAIAKEAGKGGGGGESKTGTSISDILSSIQGMTNRIIDPMSRILRGANAPAQAAGVSLPSATAIGPASSVGSNMGYAAAPKKKFEFSSSPGAELEAALNSPDIWGQEKKRTPKFSPVQGQWNYLTGTNGGM